MSQPAHSAVIGAILAGGRSSRMGSPKHAVRLPDGRAMIEHVADALRPLCASIVVVGAASVCADGAELIGARLIEDRLNHQGPLGGLQALLCASIDGGTHAIVCPCDAPLLTPDVLCPLIDAVMGSNADAAVYVDETSGKPRVHPLPLVVALTKHVQQAVNDALNSERASLRALLQAFDCTTIEFNERQARRLESCNSPEQLAAMVQSVGIDEW